jgi:uncharacterized protein YndB with AHSA1/START domain
MKFETSTVINRPLEEVFAVLSNVENNPKWASAFLEAKKTSDGPIGVGTTWRGVGKVLGQRIETELECTEYEPNRKSAQKSKSKPFPSEVRQTFEPVEGGTRVGVVLQAEPGGFFKLAEPLVNSMLKRGIETDLASLKDMMEAHAL